MRFTFWHVALGLVACSSVLCQVDINPAHATEISNEADEDASSPPAAESDGIKRVVSGLQALYDFSETSGAVVRDRSGVGRPANLRISDEELVRRSAGSLEVIGKTIIRSGKPPTKIIESVRRSGEITVEAWIRSTKTNQDGPARILTLSRSGTERNVTLGQDKDRIDVRFRTLQTSANGLPSVSSKKKSLTTDLTHVVYTRDRTGRSRIYLNGQPTVEDDVPGAPLNWHGQFRLALANEQNRGRPWLGTYYLVAIYSRDLLPHEVEQNFQAGPNARAELAATSLATSNGNIKLGVFERHVAPLLIQHCFECHDSTSHEGGLDLSRKVAAFAGGDSGPSLVPGNATDSLLWEMVESDEMPADRTPLAPDEKQLLRKWIDAGADWTAETIDPAAYSQDRITQSNWLRRLTVSEYIETVRSAVGVDVEREARDLLPPDLRADGFSNTAYNLNVDLAHVEAYAKLAEMIVERMDVLKFARRFTKSRRLTDPNMRPLITKMGKWLLRGPLEDHEVDVFRGISTTVASAGGNFESAVGYILQAMLQSPRFIYRVENQRGDGTTWPVGDFELASRLSYILWGGPPDEELMRAADDGELYNRDEVAAQVRRMLKDPRAVDRSAQFAYEWLNLGRLDNLQPNPRNFPNWDSRLAVDMRNETLAFFKEVVWNQNRPLADLLNGQFTYATARLAKHYGLEPQSEQEHEDPLVRYDLSAIPGRGGLLTHGSVLTVGGDEASMVTRGLFVLQDVLRGSVKDPPPGLDTTPVPTKPGLSQRRIAEQRIANQACGGCHVKFEPLAFGLERFDGLGAYHEQDEHGNKLRDDGEILFPGTTSPVPYQSSAELMDLLANSERVRETITWKLTQFALGRSLGPLDAPIVERIHAAAWQDGGTYAGLISAIVMSDLVQMTRTEPEKQEPEK